MNKRICLALDLKDDPELIKKYMEYHEPGNVWPEVIHSLHDSGILNMEIYLSGNRLFMVLEVDEKFTLENKTKMDLANTKVQEWESLMQKNFQQALPWKDNMVWEKMERVFNLEDH